MLPTLVLKLCPQALIRPVVQEHLDAAVVHGWRMVEGLGEIASHPGRVSRLTRGRHMTAGSRVFAGQARAASPLRWATKGLSETSVQQGFRLARQEGLQAVASPALAAHCCM